MLPKVKKNIIVVVVVGVIAWAVGSCLGINSWLGSYYFDKPGVISGQPWIYIDSARNRTTTIVPAQALSRALEHQLALDRIFLITHRHHRAERWVRLWITEASRRQYSSGISLDPNQGLAENLVRHNTDEALRSLEQELFPTRQFALRESLNLTVQVEVWLRNDQGQARREWLKSFPASENYAIIDTTAPRSHQYLRYEERALSSFEELAGKLATSIVEELYRNAGAR